MTVLLLLACFYLPGAAWEWILPCGAHGEHRHARWILIPTRAMLLSLPAALLLALGLAAHNALQPHILALALAAIAVTGLIMGVRHAPRELRLRGRIHAMGIIALALGYTICMRLPDRGQWIAGGWDPGVYINEGIAIGRTGSLHPAPSPAYQALASHGAGTFARDMGYLLEAFPGIPIDPSSGAFDFYFYPLTPVLTAVLYLCGGIAAAVRLPLILGFLIVVALLAMLTAHRLRPVHIVASLLLFVCQPIFLYHAHTPTSEMLELLLVCGVCFWISALPGGFGRAIVLATTLFAGCINRPSFILFGALFVLLLTLADLPRVKRHDVLAEHALLGIALAAAILFYRTVGADAVVKIQYAYARIESGVVLLLGGMLLVDMASRFAAVRRQFLRLSQDRRLRIPALLFILAVAGITWIRHPYTWPQSRMHVIHLLAYAGHLPVTLAGISLAAWMGRRSKGVVSGATAVSLLFLIGVTYITLRHTHIAPLYPWATKRFLMPLPLWISIAAGGTIAALWHCSYRLPRGLSRICAMSLLALSLLLNARRSWHAWDRTEYDRVVAALKPIADAIHPRDVLVADHFVWGTPLALTFGRQTFNGERLWADPTQTRLTAAARLLTDLRNTGRTVWFLTTSEEGIDIFPEPFRQATRVRQFPVYSYREIAHHRRSYDFWMYDRQIRFRLYRWRPTHNERIL